MPTPEIKLPDFEDMLALAAEIRDLMIRKGLLEYQIKSRESEIYKIMSTNTGYFINGKPPSTAHVKSTYEYPGLDGELLEKRKELVEIIAELDYKDLVLSVMKMQVDIYRTESANKRSSL